MTESPLLSKSKAFALEIIKVCNEVKSVKRESVLTNQLIRPAPALVPISVKRFVVTVELTLLQSCKLR